MPGSDHGMDPPPIEPIPANAAATPGPDEISRKRNRRRERGENSDYLKLT